MPQSISTERMRMLIERQNEEIRMRERMRQQERERSVPRPIDDQANTISGGSGGTFRFNSNGAIRRQQYSYAPIEDTNPTIDDRYVVMPNLATDSYGNLLEPETPNRTKEEIMKIQKEKSDYFAGLTEDTARKEFPFIGDPENANTYFAVKCFDSGLIIAFSMNNGVRESRMSLEELKPHLKIGFITLNTSRNAIIDHVNDLCIAHNGISFQTIFSNNVDNHILQNITGLYLEIEGNTQNMRVFYDKSMMYGNYEIAESYDMCMLTKRFTVEKTPNEGYLQRLVTEINRTHEVLRTEIRELIRQNSVINKKPNTKSKKNQSWRKGKYVNHDIPFSCEVECYLPDKVRASKVSREIPKDFGLSNDGSLNSGIGYPIEIQTSVLKGKKGEVAIAQNLCSKLIEHGAMIDKTCGLHIHLDTNNIMREPGILSNERRPDKLIAMYLFYRVFEPVIVSFLPSTRRANRYCSTFKDGAVHNEDSLYHEATENVFNVMSDIRNLEQFELFWYKVPTREHVKHMKGSRYIVSRYFGVNFHSMLKDYHLEIRYHSGTLNYEKILYWIDLHGSIIENCANGRITESTLHNIFGSNMPLEQLTQTMFDMLSLNKDTVEYLVDRQQKFKDVKNSEEILIDKTKTVSVA